MGRKLKIYLDTSTISYLQEEHSPDKMAATRKLWAKFEEGFFDVFLSQTTMKELGRCPEPKLSVLLGYLSKIQYKVLDIDQAVMSLAQKIVEEGVLTRTSLDDCAHIAAAAINGCDCVVSWNFRHMVRQRTIDGVRRIVAPEGYGGLEIITPWALLGKGDASYEN